MKTLEFIFVALLFFSAGAYFHKPAAKVAAHISRMAQ
jgi:hypothetical protein